MKSMRMIQSIKRSEVVFKRNLSKRVTRFNDEPRSNGSLGKKYLMQKEDKVKSNANKLTIRRAAKGFCASAIRNYKKPKEGQIVRSRNLCKLFSRCNLYTCSNCSNVQYRFYHETKNTFFKNDVNKAFKDEGKSNKVVDISSVENNAAQDKTSIQRNTDDKSKIFSVVKTITNTESFPLNNSNTTSPCEGVPKQILSNVLRDFKTQSNSINEPENSIETNTNPKYYVKDSVIYAPQINLKDMSHMWDFEIFDKDADLKLNCTKNKINTKDCCIDDSIMNNASVRKCFLKKTLDMEKSIHNIEHLNTARSNQFLNKKKETILPLPKAKENVSDETNLNSEQHKIKNSNISRKQSYSEMSNHNTWRENANLMNQHKGNSNEYSTTMKNNDMLTFLNHPPAFSKLYKENITARDINSIIPTANDNVSSQIKSEINKSNISNDISQKSNDYIVRNWKMPLILKHSSRNINKSRNNLKQNVNKNRRNLAFRIGGKYKQYSYNTGSVDDDYLVCVTKSNKCIDDKKLTTNSFSFKTKSKNVKGSSSKKKSTSKIEHGDTTLHKTRKLQNYNKNADVINSDSLKKNYTLKNRNTNFIKPNNKMDSMSGDKYKNLTINSKTRMNDTDDSWFSEDKITKFLLRLDKERENSPVLNTFTNVAETYMKNLALSCKIQDDLDILDRRIHPQELHKSENERKNLAGYNENTNKPVSSKTYLKKYSTQSGNLENTITEVARSKHDIDMKKKKNNEFLYDSDSGTLKKHYQQKTLSKQNALPNNNRNMNATTPVNVEFQKDKTLQENTFNNSYVDANCKQSADFNEGYNAQLMKYKTNNAVSKTNAIDNFIGNAEQFEVDFIKSQKLSKTSDNTNHYTSVLQTKEHISNNTYKKSPEVQYLDDKKNLNVKNFDRGLNPLPFNVGKPITIKNDVMDSWNPQGNMLDYLADNEKSNSDTTSIIQKHSNTSRKRDLRNYLHRYVNKYNAVRPKKVVKINKLDKYIKSKRIRADRKLLSTRPTKQKNYEKSVSVSRNDKKHVNYQNEFDFNGTSLKAKKKWDEMRIVSEYPFYKKESALNIQTMPDKSFINVTSYSIKPESENDLSNSESKIEMTRDDRVNTNRTDGISFWEVMKSPHDAVYTPSKKIPNEHLHSMESNSKNDNVYWNNARVSEKRKEPFCDYPNSLYKRNNLSKIQRLSDYQKIRENIKNSSTNKQSLSSKGSNEQHKPHFHFRSEKTIDNVGDYNDVVNKSSISHYNKKTKKSSQPVSSNYQFSVNNHFTDRETPNLYKYIRKTYDYCNTLKSITENSFEQKTTPKIRLGIQSNFDKQRTMYSHGLSDIGQVTLEHLDDPTDITLRDKVSQNKYNIYKMLN